ncbi:MAG: hypothetical protein ACI4L9_04405 [Candidatus Coproplasma sp.]
MFYRLKTSMMKAIIAKKQKNQPFDFDAAEAFCLKPDDGDDINNSYYFSAHDVDSSKSLFLRLGVRNCFSEVWFYYSDGEDRYVCEDEIFKENCPLKVNKSGQEWRVIFCGKLKDGKGEEVDAKFIGAFKATAPAIDFFSDMPPVRTAKAMAFEKWTKNYFAEVQSNNQVHYEQTGIFSGSLEIDGQTKEISMPCVRDHSFGKRDWNYMNNHLWLMAVNGNSQLNFSMVSYPAMTMLEVGNYCSQDKPAAYVLSAEYDRKSVAECKVPENFEITLDLTDGTKLNVKASKRDQVRYTFADGKYVLVEGVADYEINGRKLRGIFEIGANADSARIFNGVKTGRLKP